MLGKMQQVVIAGGVILQREIKAQLVGTPGTGELQRSIRRDTRKQLDRRRPRVRVGSGKDYARIVEQGGIVQADGGYLTVPLNAEAAAIRKGHKSLKGLGFTIIKSKGKYLLGYRTSRKNFRPMFVLVKWIAISPKWYFREGVAAAQPKIRAVFNKFFPTLSFDRRMSIRGNYRS